MLKIMILNQVNVIVIHINRLISISASNDISASNMVHITEQLRDLMKYKNPFTNKEWCTSQT